VEKDSALRLIEFIRNSLGSIWALRLLMVMHASPLRLWSEGELVGELRASTAVVRGVLGRFEAEGLIARKEGDRYKFQPESSSLDRLCDALAEAYRRRPHTVMQAITARDDQVEALAAAFRLHDESG